MADSAPELDRILDTATALIAADGYADLTLTAIARAAQLPLSDVYRHVADRPAILAALMRRTDLAVLEEPPELSDGDPPRDRIFEFLMARFERLAGWKPALRVILHDLRRRPAEALLLAPSVVRSMRWMAEAAGLPVTGLGGAARVRALMGVYATILPIWLEDDDPGYAKTMAALDRRLRRLEQMWPGVWGKASESQSAAAAS